jgi:hypothetical protein
MAFHNGTNLVRNNLTFAIDVLSENCYPGSGTTVTDLMGNRSGTLTNGPTIGTSPTKHINFDGSNDYLLYSNYIPSELTTDSYSLEFWFTNNAGGGYEGVFGMGAGFQIYARSSKLEIYQSNNGSATYNVVNGVKNSTSLGSEGDWNCAVLHRSGTTITFFINGVADGQHSASSGNTMGVGATTDMLIGTYSTGQFRYGGELGPVRIYNRALTTAEINQNFNQQRDRFGV